MDARSQRAVRGAILRNLGAGLAGLLTYPIIARVLGRDALGAWALIGTMAFLQLLCDLGLTTAVQRAAVTADRARAERALQLALATVLVLVPVVGVPVYLYLTRMAFSDASASLQAQVPATAGLALVAGSIGAMAGPMRGFLFARGAAGKLGTARTLGLLTQVSVIAAGVFVSRSLALVAFGILIGQSLELTLILRAIRAVDPDLHVRPRVTKDRGEIVRCFRDGAATLVAQASIVLAVRVDLVVLTNYAPLAVLAAYSVAQRAVEQSWNIANQTPSLTKYLGDAGERGGSVRFGTLVLGTVVMSGMAALALAGQPLLVGWVGDVAAGVVTARTLVLLAVAASLASLYEVAVAMVTLSSRTAWASAIPKSIASVVNLSFSLAGAPFIGIWAVAGSTAVGNLIEGILIWRKGLRLLQWDFRTWGSVLGPVLAAGLASGFVAHSLSSVAELGAFASIGCCAVAMGFGCMVSVGATKVLRPRTPPATGQAALDPK